jgi:WD40 repeat protein
MSRPACQVWTGLASIDAVGDGDVSAPRSGRTGTAEAEPYSAGDAICPYQGLAPFEAENAAMFFGRARATRGLVDRLGRRLDGHGSILMVSGASGAGKSSLLRAGLLPALAQGALPVARDWPRLLVTPTATPLRTLTESWTKAYGDTPDGPFVLVVDQFEELFTLVTDERERQAYVSALSAMAERAGVVIGVRADYWDRCAAYPEFAEAIQDGQVIVESMSAADLRLAITGPAAAVGLELEPGLVETILAELGATEPGALPLLSQALRNTWDRRVDGRLTVRGYEESGRVRDAVQHTADEVFQRLSTADRKIALRVFRRMTVVTAGGRVARRRVTLTELHAAASAERRDHVDALLAAFADRRLLTLDENTAEIAHDALLTAWPAMRQWLAPDLAAQAVYDALIEDATEWDDHHRDPAFLYRGGRLLAVGEARPRWDRDAGFPPPGPVVDAFVAASTQAAGRAGRRRRLVLAGLAVLSALALIASGLAVRAAGQAGHQRALAVSRQLAAQSEAVDDPVTSSLLAAAAWRIAPTPEARQSLLDGAARPSRAVLTGHTAPIRTLAVSGHTLATGSTDGTVRLWDLATHRGLGAPLTHPPADGAADIGAVAFSPDGRTLATANLSTVRFWNVATRRPVGLPLHNQEAVSAMAVSPDGLTLAAASIGGTVRLWDVPTRRQHGATIGRPAQGIGRAIAAVAFTPDGAHLVTAGARIARLWDTGTHHQVGRPFTGHADHINDISVSPDGRTLATTSLDGAVRLWSLATHRATGTPLHDPDGRSGFRGVAFSPDGSRLATAGDRIRLWDVAGHEPIGPAFPDDARSMPAEKIAFSPDGRTLATGDDGGAVRLWDPVVHEQIGETLRGISAVAMSPAGRIVGISRSTLRLWDVAAHRPVGAPLRPADPLSRGDRADVGRIAFTPDGRTFITDSGDDVRLWDTTTLRQIGPPVYAAAHSGVAVSPDGRTLAVVDVDSVRLWQVAGRRPLGSPISLPGHTGVFTVAAFSPDGGILATSGADHTARLIDVATQRQIGSPLPIAGIGFFDQLAFSPDGTVLAAGGQDRAIRLWDVRSHRQIGVPLTGHTGRVTAIAFSPDGTALVTGSADTSVRRWDLTTHRQIGIPLTGHRRAVSGVVYSRNGAAVATASDDGTARWWNVAAPADPAATACANAARTLTRDEWRRYVPGEKYRQVCP